MFNKFLAVLRGDKYLDATSKNGSIVYLGGGGSRMHYSDGTTLLITDGKGLKSLSREEMSPADLALYDALGYAALGWSGLILVVIGILVGVAV